MKISILSFSPTGRTGQVAAMLGEAVESRGHQVQRLEMARRDLYRVPSRLERFLAEELADHDLLMVGGPVYAGHLQSTVRDIIAALPPPERWTGRAAVPFVTWGGRTSGVALVEAARALRRGGRVPVLGFKALSFHSMSSAFERPINPGLPGDEAREAAEALARRIETINHQLPRDASSLLSPPSLKTWVEAALFSEALFQQKIFPPVEIDPSRCTRCGRCVKGCPVQIIRREGEGFPVRTDGCIHCGECQLHCPADAVVYDGRKLEAQITKVAVYGPTDAVERPANTCVLG